MEYRKLPHGAEQISVIGLGTSVVGEHSVQNVVETVTFALDSGVNYIDLAGGHAAIFPGIGEALAGRRKDAYLQLHFGADYTSGEYGWNPTLDGVKRSVAWQLEQLKTDYIDFGFMHCLDEIGDLEDYERNGILRYLLDLKAQGVVKHIGLSTHVPKLASRVLDMGILDMMMFSINPMYDYGHGDFSIGSASERYSLYTRCEKEGVGISVMKPFNAGQLLDAKKSPIRPGAHARAVHPVRARPPRRPDRHAGRGQCGGAEAQSVLSRRERAGAGLFRHCLPHAEGHEGYVRVLQALPSLPGGTGYRPHQQVLRSVPSGRRTRE